MTAPIRDTTDRSVTMGFELEFQRNAQPLAAALFQRGAVGDGSIHGWHCDCTICEGDYDFKVQRDSTVDGEVISRVFDDWDHVTAAMLDLQEAAVEADAEPGLNAGLHVHIAQPTSRQRRGRAFLAYLVWERALIDIARGRFPHLRDMNRSVVADVRSWLLYSACVTTRPEQWIRTAVEQARAGDNDPACTIWAGHFDADRHSHLSVNTRFNTWEFRIWNSTRSAWRMELACRLSVAFRSPDFVGHLLDHDGDRNPAALLDIVASEWQADDRLAALLDRQLAYMPRAHEAPAQFLVA